MAMSASTDANDEDAAPVRPARDLHFPDDHAVGMIIVTDPAGGGVPAPQPAQGTIHVPPGHAATFIFNPGGEVDVAALEALDPDSLDMAMNAPANNNACLAALARLTSLSAIMSQGEVDDEGLKHLSGMTNLGMLVVQVGAVTAEGIGHLARLPNLARLVLAGPVSADALRPLADAPRLGGLQIPMADEDTVEAVRDLLPDLNINGVWLSPKARRQMAAAKLKSNPGPSD
ncbi:MAG: hypothetical protein QOK43_287 [Acidimicrobiaceae bacterium]|nr:hypothetical protein [Acidimicrobiaceae bacterium]